MKSRDKLVNLISQIKNAKSESSKAVSYSEGYLDCLKDILNDDCNDLNKIIMVKYDGKVREEVYSEVLPILEAINSQNLPGQEVSSPTGIVSDETSESSVMHPSDRARSFLERIGRA
jgi:hypothetical protein